MKSNKIRIETLVDDIGNVFSRHAGKVKVLKSHYEKFRSELQIRFF